MDADAAQSPGSGIPAPARPDAASNPTGGSAPRAALHARTAAVNWAALAALAASVTALAAVCIAVTVFWEVRQDAQRMRLNTGLETLGRFDSDWNSTDMAARRGAAASALLDGHPTHDLDEVLDFFEQIAMLLSRGALDEELVWYDFYWPMANYWSAGHEHVQEVQRNDPTAWAQLQTLVPQLAAIEARRKHRAMSDAGPSKAQTREFLKSEASQAACEEDDQYADTRKLEL